MRKGFNLTSAPEDFAGGLYHGRIVLPVNYPLSPPSIMMLNPNGRFETVLPGKAIPGSMVTT